MVQNFKIITKDGLCYQTTYLHDNDRIDEILKEREQKELKEIINKVMNAYNVGISWQCGDKTISLINDDVIKGCPSVDLKYVIAIYLGSEGEYAAPCNAVIYNADGSIHKKLCVPLLISNAAKDRGIYRKQFNASIGFFQVSWQKDSNGNMVVAIEVKETTYGIFREIRVLNPETGEFGECLYGAIEYK